MSRFAQSPSGRMLPGSWRESIGLFVAISILWSLCPGRALARPVRRVFEPMDLEFEDSGSFEQAYSFGLIRGEDAYRLSLPDFEFSLGVTDDIEFDLDGESAFAGDGGDSLDFDSYAPDNLWPSIKYGFVDYADDREDLAWALGLQVGPKFPLARNARGVGVEGTLLFGVRFHQAHFVLNAGGLRDPGGGGGVPRPSGPELGLDIDFPLDADGHWSIGGGIGAVLYTSPDPDQATVILGVDWAPIDALTLSISGLYGLLSAGDQYGILLGVAPKVHLW